MMWFGRGGGGGSAGGVSGFNPVTSGNGGAGTGGVGGTNVTYFEGSAAGDYTRYNELLGSEFTVTVTAQAPGVFRDSINRRYGSYVEPVEPVAVQEEPIDMRKVVLPSEPVRVLDMSETSIETPPEPVRTLDLEGE